MLNIVENILEIDPDLGEQFTEKTDILRWLLQRVQIRYAMRNT